MFALITQNRFGIILLFCLSFFQSISAEWSAPVTISNLYSNVPAVGIDTAGNGVAVWQDYADGSYIESAIYSKENGWSPVIPISYGDSPKVAVDPAGNAVAVWRSSVGGSDFVIKAAALPFGSTVWIPSVGDLSASGQDSFSPQVCVDKNGNAVAIWSRSNGTIGIIQGAILPFGSTTWIPTSDLSSGSNSGEPQLAVDKDGNAFAIWANRQAAGIVIQSSRLPFGSTNWSASAIISDPLEYATEPQIAVDSKGNAVAVWTIYGTYSILQAAKLPSGGSWTFPYSLTDTSSKAVTPKVTFDSWDNALVVWVDWNASDYSVMSSRLPYGDSNWEIPQKISETSSSAISPQIAADGKGNAIAIWGLLYGGAIAVQASQYSDKGVWEAPVTISPLGVDCVLMQLAVNQGGKGIAVWNNECESTIQAAVYASNPIPIDPPSPPQNVVGKIKTNKFLNKTECFLNVTWQPSPSSDVVAYRIYHKNRLIESIGTGRLTFTRRLRHCSGRGYSIAAVNKDQIESPRIAIDVTR